MMARPVVSGEFLALVKFANKSLSSMCLTVMRKRSAYFVLGKKMAKDGAYEYRSDYLLKSVLLLK